MVLLTWLLLLAQTVSPPAPDGGWQTYVERNESGRQVRHHFRGQDGRYELRTDLETGYEHQVYTLDAKGETVAWQYEDSSRDTRLSATLSPNRRIRLTGRHHGKALDKTYQINDQPWNQRFQQGLTDFLRSGQDKTVFWTIGTRGKGELRISRFTARRESAQPLPAALQQAGHPGPFHHIKLTLYGMLSVFWSGHYWYEAANGSFLFYSGKSSHLDGEVVLIRSD